MLRLNLLGFYTTGNHFALPDDDPLLVAETEPILHRSISANKGKPASANALFKAKTLKFIVNSQYFEN